MFLISVGGQLIDYWILTLPVVFVFNMYMTILLWIYKVK